MHDEGGSEYTCTPGDRGGPTKYGITLGSWRAFMGRADLTPLDVENISETQARAFYTETLWRPLMLDRLPTKTSTCLLNIATLCGPSRAVRMAQVAVGEKADGIMGPKTAAVLAKCSEREFILLFVPLVIDRFVGIVQTDMSQVAFLRNWTRRAARLLSLAL